MEVVADERQVVGVRRDQREDVRELDRPSDQKTVMMPSAKLKSLTRLTTKP